MTAKTGILLMKKIAEKFVSNYIFTAHNSYVCIMSAPPINYLKNLALQLVSFTQPP